MAEQQQDVGSVQQIQSDILVEKQPISISTPTTKIHKTKRHRRRQSKYPSSQVTAAEMDIETDPAVPALSKKTNVVEPVVPTTPAIVKDVDDALSPRGAQGDHKGFPYIASFQHVGETLAVSLFVKPFSLHTWRSLSWRIVLTYTLLALLLTNSFLLWQDLMATHVYVNMLNASDGTVRTQEDIGDYRGAIRLTAPLAINTNAMLGVYDASDQRGTQQLLTFHQTASSLALQHSASLANGAITQDTHGHLLVENANGLQVMTQDGQVVWQMQGQQPTHGVHPFVSASDTATVYTITSVTRSQVAAYALTDGHRRWTRTLPDTLAYAPPFLVNGDTLYSASDHNIFALNSSDGSIRWEKPYAARTLLLENTGQQPFLLVLSSQGVQALQSTTGELLWSFRGAPGVSTLPTQFYQGTLSHVSDTERNTLYATGVVWQIPNVREDVWLYAIDAITGKMRWSQRIASGPTGVDAGRVLQPLLDTENHTVLVQYAAFKNENGVAAYDAQTGRQRWNTPIAHMNTSSPNVFQLSKNTLAVFTTTTDSAVIFWTPSFYRDCLFLLLFVSVTGLLLLLFLRAVGTDASRPLGLLIAGRDAMHRSLLLVRRRWRYSYTLSALVFLCICIGISIFAYLRSGQPAQTVLANDAQGSVVVTDTSDNMHQLEAINSSGTRQWTLFRSEGTFSIPNAQTQTGTLLVALHGDTPHTYVVAVDDPAYPRPLNSMLALYLLNRATGRVLWQQVVSYPDEQQSTQVLGADKTYIYIMGEHTLPAQGNAKNLSVPQLFAVNTLTGTVDWRIFGPTQRAGTHNNSSTVLLKNGLALWHVGNTVFTIDTHVGQIIGRK